MECSFYVFECALIIFVNSLCVNLFGCSGQKIDGANNLEIIGKDIFFEIVKPENLRYTYRTRPAKNFGTQFNNGFLAKNIKLVPIDPPNGCSWPNNAYEISGNIAFVERGECSFLSKTLRAEKAGAKAVIISDNIPSDEFYTEMIDDLTGREVNIPATFLLGKNGQVIRNTLRELKMDYAIINIPVNVTFVPLPEWKQPPWLTW
ncbi:PRADC1-like protein [Rhodnius prolixus]|uniref:PRADC1-like protein n=1 Tax=Rhodnius prolixus TaxID=13249 RepID=UPI003D18C29B